ncbi:DNA recombination protein RmuC [Candidatus Bipolaricaulota bacterium]|jgi:DNA recombination protein RmuC|nr:DNA recombination protein RmuC [Candidatus Bipolaricaulota bacterium]
MEWLYLAAGLIIGAIISWLVLRVRAQARMATLRVAAARLEEELRAERDKAASLDAVQERMRETFTALAHQALTSNSEQLLARSRDQLAALLQQVRGDWGTHKQELKGLVDPLNKALETMDQQVRALEQKREGAYQSLGEQLRNLGEAQTRLQSTSTTLMQAMKSSTARGKWGELQLRRVVELAGMTKHVDFQEQVAAESGRPDMIVRLPNEGILPIDAKAPAAAYLDAMNLEGEARTQKLADHAKAMRSRIQELSRKAYMDQFEKAPEIVVMFVPFESALSAAFESDPGLLEYGIEQRILIASPVTLLALLRAAAFGWQQYHIAENARLIADQGRELYVRFLNVIKPVADVGDKLGKAVDAYNKAVGSMETRLMPALRKMKDSAAAPEEPPILEPLEQNPRLPLDVGE